MDASLTVEFRCPVGAGGLFFKLLGTPMARVDENNLVEVNCRSCARVAREENPEVLLVLHRFALDGECVETETV